MGEVDLHAVVNVRMTRVVDGEERHKLIKTTPGRIIFNEGIPQDLGYVDRSIEENLFELELNTLVDKSKLGDIVDRCYRLHGTTITAEVLDRIKRKGYKFATRAGITIGVTDIEIPEEKEKILSRADEKVDQVELLYRRGLISDDERYEKTLEIWTHATDEITETLMNSLDKFNSIYMMANSGARGNKQQIRQLAGMRGLMADPSGRIIDLPIKANFREGLTVLEYFISTHGARKGLADTALRTADSGYLTRRLVDVSQDVIVREIDCGTTEGIVVRDIRDGSEIIEDLKERIVGRYALEEVLDPKTGDIIVGEEELITEDAVERIINAGIKQVKIRSVLTCRTRHGVCAKCYGRNMATGKPVNIGEAVGIIAAQSIGEPGTQLTMRTFHTGGVAGQDITQGLPRVEELFEARKPKGQAVITEVDGTAKILESKKKREVEITTSTGETKVYQVPYGARLRVDNGSVVEAGDELCEGSVNPHDILRIKGIRGVQTYLLQEVLRVYRLQGVDINDKHIEVIIRQMLRKVKIEDPGDTDLLPGELVDVFEFEELNEKAILEGKAPAEAKRVLLGITKASLATDSFLSAASFQETTRVLTDAAIKGKSDPLLGLKENVIIGKLIPAGTGMSRYRNIKIHTPGEELEKDLLDAENPLIDS